MKPKTSKKTVKPRNKTGKKGLKTYKYHKKDLLYNISKKGAENAKRKTFSISKPFIKRNYPFQNIIPIYDKLIEYGLDNITKYRDTHLRIKINEDCELSIIYLYNDLTDKYNLESMLIFKDKSLNEKEKEKYMNCYSSNEDQIKLYKSIKELYNTILLMKKC
jgi:hypothetical protein